MSLKQAESPNLSIMPSSARVNQLDHLVIGGCDTVELVEKFGTPLWIIDHESIEISARLCQEGLRGYPDSLALYAGKAFICSAMCKIIERLGLGIDVVSEGELYTALESGFDSSRIYLHGNNKSLSELTLAMSADREVKVVVDNLSELLMLKDLAREKSCRPGILLRVIPGVEPDTHDHVKTGQSDSKFGIPLEQIEDILRQYVVSDQHLDFLGLHAHIGSQAHEIEPFLEIIDILADLAHSLFTRQSLSVRCLDVGGGLGIAYTEDDNPLSIKSWAESIAGRTIEAFSCRGLALPRLLVEPGRSIVGTAGVTLYRAGHAKTLPSGDCYMSVDGGMADNPRPATYNARYSCSIANRMNARANHSKITLVGRYCESGDIIIKNAGVPAVTGDLIAVFGTGAYNYSMSSNYNRTGRPACVLVKDGNADLILERESYQDLMRMDRIPDWLQ